MYHFIVNPVSGGGRGERVWKRLEKLLKRRGVEYKAFLTQKAWDARLFAADLTDSLREPRIIIIVGGDGTVNEVLDGLAFASPITLGYIPAGGGNDLARSLKLPRSPARCLRKILNPKYHKLMDYGVMSYGEELGHRRFMVSAGIGLDASICHKKLESGIKTGVYRMWLGKFVRIATGLKQFLAACPVKGYLLLDGTQKVEYNHIYFVSVQNHPFEGDGFRFAPDADPCDGKMDICVAHHACKLKLFPALLRARFGRGRKGHGIRVFNCKEAEIHLERPMPVHADGESCLCQTDLQIRCIPKKVRFIV